MTRPYTHHGGHDGAGDSGDTGDVGRPPTGPVVLGDRYELVEYLGRGGMAEVHRAHDRHLGRVVAVKLLPAEQRHDEVSTRRLQDEARAAGGLSHPNVVAVHDVGSSPHGVYVVMELLEGRTWHDELALRGPPPEPEAVRVTAAVADALAHAHARGITHRDVNPANVMLLADGTPKLMDFGIARLVGAGGLTETGTVVGTPTYMSPEQVRGDELDGRSDVYSLGCTLYEALTGAPPFRGSGSADVAAVRLREPPAPPRRLRPELTVGVEDLVLRTLSLDPSARPDAATLAGALLALGRRDERPPAASTAETDVIAAVGSDPGGTPEKPEEPEEPPAPDAPAPSPGLRRVGIVLVALGVLAIVVVGAVLLGLL